MKLNNNFLLPIIIILGSIFHILFFGVNEILKNADSFAYLQMSYHFKNLSLEGFGTGWFGFLYSLFISIFDLITFPLNEYYIALYLNIILYGISAYLLYKIGELFLKKKYNLLLVTLFYLSPILLSFNITILSENIYIPLFLGFVLFLLKNYFHKNFFNIFVISLFLALLYFTRAEAFIYIGSVIFIIFLNQFIKNNGNFLKKIIETFKKSTLILIFFVLIIFPYLVHLHSITGNWGLTNKGSSNLRQAELRGKEKMDDSGFEQAVGELTSDNHFLKSGFVGGLSYNKGEKGQNLKSYLLENPSETIKRIIDNQIKLYTKNLPELIIGDSIKLFYSKDSLLYKNYLFLIFSLIPLFLIIFGIYRLVKNKNYNFLIIFFSFFFIGSLFFTLFFVLNRYFLIFLPLFLVFLVYGIQELNYKLLKNASILIILLIYILGNYTYYNNVKLEDIKYEVKKVAGVWIKNNLILNTLELNTIKIMERFPILTYYSGTKERWLTPYTDNIENLIEYAKYNKINYLVVDTLDFKTYRPKLNYLLNDDYKNNLLIKINTFQVNKEKVILYKFNF